MRDIYTRSSRRHLCDACNDQGQWSAIFLSDVASGAMLKNIVDRAKTKAVKASILGGDDVALNVELLGEAVEDEFVETRGSVMDVDPVQWSRINGMDNGRVVRIRPVPRKEKGEHAMTVRRVMGTETEYAVSAPAVSHANPVQLSFDVIGAAADPERSRIRWDYRQEDPVNDARGTRLERAAARPDMLTDEPQLNIVNVIAPQRRPHVRVDHAHPEYSAPETTDPFEAVRYDHAGDLLMRRAAAAASAGTGHDIVLHRNNVDGKGASWGTRRELHDAQIGAVRHGWRR